MSTTAPRAGLAEIALPDFGMPQHEPLLPPTLFVDRVARLRERMDDRGYDQLIVWGDREHSANMAYLTGFDPRFEEAMLIVGAATEPAIAVGNECHGLAEAAPLPMRVLRFQDFSLPGQARDASLPLPQLLAGEGIGAGSRVGVVAWKTYATRDTIEAPAFLVDELRRLTGGRGLVENANDLLIDAADGLRVVNEVEQLAAFEWAACHTSRGVRNVVTGLRPGMSEREAVRLLSTDRARRSVHELSGRLCRPERRRVARRRHRLRRASGRAVLRSGRRVVWRAARRPAGRRAASDHRRLGDPFFGVSLNPGHQLHLDEWLNSPVFAGSTVELRSGMALQCDIIPATGTPYFTTNIEDGVALADESLRATFAAAYPDAWRRIQARRRFMTDALGIELHPDVLPFSNLAAHLPPFLLSPDLVMTLAA